MQVLNKLSKTSVVIDVLNKKEQKMYADKVRAVLLPQLWLHAGLIFGVNLTIMG